MCEWIFFFFLFTFSIFFLYDVRGNRAGVTQPRKMRMDLLFCFFIYLLFRFFFLYDVRGHRSGVTQPRKMRMDLFLFIYLFDFLLQFSPLFLSSFFFIFVSSHLRFYCAFIQYFCFDPASLISSVRRLKKMTRS